MSDSLFDHYFKITNRYLNTNAIDGPDGALSFKELDELSDRIGLELLLSDNDSFVLFMHPSKYYFASLVACMKTGKIAVPVEPADTDDVVRKNVNQISDYACLTTSALYERSVTLFKSKKILQTDCLSASDEKPACPDIQNPLFYPLHRVFTSGTSGRQKLITISREAEYVHSKEASEMYRYRPGIAMANLGRHSSSSIINGFWRCILAGASFLYFDLKREAFGDISKRLIKSDIKFLQGPSTLMEKFLISESARYNFTGIEHLVFGGEPLNPGLLTAVSDYFKPNCLVTLNYSSSETMLISAYTSTLEKMQQLDKIPVGTPAPSKKVRLVHEQENITSVNQPGEVVVSSKHIALSVIKNGKEQMINEPEEPNLRTYYTGDLAKWNNEGILEYLGRKDAQVKINGVRIDTHIIESKLRNIDGVENAVVIQESVEAGNKQLFAFLVGRRNNLSDLKILKQLSKELRTTFLPNHFTDIDQIPVNSRGKTDFGKLKAMCLDVEKKSRQRSSRSSANYSEMEVFLQKEWEKVLEKTISDKKVTFFAAGGDSLAISELTLNIRKKLTLNIDIAWVFEYPTIEVQAAFLESIASVDKSQINRSEIKKDSTEKSDINKLLGL